MVRNNSSDSEKNSLDRGLNRYVYFVPDLAFVTLTLAGKHRRPANTCKLVRFNCDPPQFRILFVDNLSCLSVRRMKHSAGRQSSCLAKQIMQKTNDLMKWKAKAPHGKLN